MFTASTAMSCSAKNPDLVNKIAFLHKSILAARLPGRQAKVSQEATH